VLGAIKALQQSLQVRMVEMILRMPVITDINHKSAIEFVVKPFEKVFDQYKLALNKASSANIVALTNLVSFRAPENEKEKKASIWTKVF
jgi:hypothetical protein